MNPSLFERLCWPVASEHVVICDQEPPPAAGFATSRTTGRRAPRPCLPTEFSKIHVKWESAWLRVEPKKPWLSAALEKVFHQPLHATPETPSACLLGVGLPHDLPDVLNRLAHENRQLSIWERDPWLLRLLLGAFDLRGPIEDGTLEIWLGSDLIEKRAFFSSAQSSHVRTLHHPALARLYENEIRLSQTPPETPFVFVETSGLFVQDLVVSFRAHHGTQSFGLDLTGLAREEIERALSRHRAKSWITVNYTEGTSDLAERTQTPLLVWEVDPSTSPLPKQHNPPTNTHIFTYRRANEKAFKEAGFPVVKHLPLATNPNRRTSGPVSQAHRCAVAFVGASMRPEADNFRRAFFDATEAESLDQFVGALMSEEHQTYLDQPPPRHWSQAQIRAAFEIAAAENRRRTVTALGPFGVHVWGDTGWENLPPNCTYRGYAGHYRELTQIYNSTDIVVDIGRLYQRDIVTMRVFDAMACGAFVLAEQSDDLAALFDIGKEVVCYQSRDELVRMVGHYLDNPGERRALAAAGQRAVRARHTIDQRLQQMLADANLNQ